MEWELPSSHRAKSTDRDKLTANKLTANQRFCYSDFVTDFAAVISSQSEGLGMMALGIVKIYLGSPFSPISVVRGQLVRGQFVAVSLSRSVVVDPHHTGRTPECWWVP